VNEIVTLFIVEHEVSPDDAWRLVEWCHRAGADEFSLTILAALPDAQEVCQAFDQAFSRFRRDPAPRQGVMAYAGEEWVRSVPLWSLTLESIDQLRQAFPGGVFSLGMRSDVAWLENVCLYREGELLLGVVTHELLGTLRVTQVERAELDRLGISYHTQPPLQG